jgi:hypothetical protein
MYHIYKANFVCLKSWSVNQPVSVTVCCCCAMVAVGLKAARSTIVSPFDIPP